MGEPVCWENQYIEPVYRIYCVYRTQGRRVRRKFPSVRDVWRRVYFKLPSHDSPLQTNMPATPDLIPCTETEWRRRKASRSTTQVNSSYIRPEFCVTWASLVIHLHTVKWLMCFSWLVLALFLRGPWMVLEQLLRCLRNMCVIPCFSRELHPV